MLARMVKIGINKALTVPCRHRTGGLTRDPDIIRNSVLNTLQAFDRDLFGLGSQVEQHLPALKMDYVETPLVYKIEMEV